MKVPYLDWWYLHKSRPVIKWYINCAHAPGFDIVLKVCQMSPLEETRSTGVTK
jgi:hypothetical protein